MDDFDFNTNIALADELSRLRPDWDADIPEWGCSGHCEKCGMGCCEL